MWEDSYRRRDWGRYPPQEVVRFVARHCYSMQERCAVRILDLGDGRGTGASWFIACEGFALAGIDAFPTAIAKARFATEASLRQLCARFRELKIGLGVRSIDSRRHEICHWAVTCSN